MRCVFALTAMGFLPQSRTKGDEFAPESVAADEVVAVRVLPACCASTRGSAPCTAAAATRRGVALAARECDVGGVELLDLLVAQRRPLFYAVEDLLGWVDQRFDAAVGSTLFSARSCHSTPGCSGCTPPTWRSCPCRRRSRSTPGGLLVLRSCTDDHALHADGAAGFGTTNFRSGLSALQLHDVARIGLCDGDVARGEVVGVVVAGELLICPLPSAP